MTRDHQHNQDPNVNAHRIVQESARDETARPADLDAASANVRESVRRHVAAQRFAALRTKTLPFAEAQGFLTDEDLFKAIS